jgi:hypothetical protein
MAFGHWMRYRIRHGDYRPCVWLAVGSVFQFSP